MRRLLRVPVVLLVAVLWGLGSYALGFAALADSFPWALAAAFAGGVVVTGALGSLTSRPRPILLALPLAIIALTTTVYAAGVHHLRERPRLTLVVDQRQCTGTGCAYTFRDPAGRPTPFRLAGGPVHDIGDTAEVYRTGTADEVRWWPATLLAAEPTALTTARITVPLLAAYTVALGIAGALGDAATVRRFRRHMASSRPS
ncbi:hypothetical protein ACQP2P_19200 [Dactylosporangium sp. CA-139114]|uniref:hypothetical protein n=1 Tax=Dactylosporangium sp. CA-139114 TaxID=3239931 RepID=UPI003D95DBB2